MHLGWSLGLQGGVCIRREPAGGGRGPVPAERCWLGGRSKQRGQREMDANDLSSNLGRRSDVTAQCAVLGLGGLVEASPDTGNPGEGAGVVRGRCQVEFPVTSRLGSA